MAENIEYVIEPSGKKLFNWKELWQYKELFYFFTWRDVKVKYKQTSLGVLWVILQPIVSVVIFSLFFGRALNIPSLGLDYPVFVFSGLLLWNLFSAGVNNAGNSMLSNAHIIKKIYFPRLIMPVSSILVVAVDFVVAFMAFIGFLFYYKTKVDFIEILIAWPCALIIAIAGTMGISCWLAALVVKYRDFRYLIPFALQIALFVSPVIYPISIIKQQWINYILALNPMYAAINIFRAPLTDVIVLDPLLVLVSIGSALFFLIWGIYYFKKTESYFADIA